MKAPKCRTCGIEHWGSVCAPIKSTAARKDVQEAAGSTTDRDFGKKRSPDKRECSLDVGKGRRGRSAASLTEPKRLAGNQALPVDTKNSHHVYALSDPRDGVVFYVGMTKNLLRRLNDHKRGDFGVSSSSRVMELKNEGLEFVVSILHECQDKATAQILERKEIDARVGLVNIGNGGRPSTGFDKREYQRKFMADKRAATKLGISVKEFRAAKGKE